MNNHVFFNNCNSWNDFQTKLLSLNKKEKGDAFELLTKLYFKINPVFSFYDEVWMLSEVPQKTLEYLNIPSHDLGIDLIAKNRDEYHAIQCKFHTDIDSSVSFREVATFISLLEGNKNFTQGYICSSANITSRNFEKIETKPITTILADTWQNLDKDFFDKARNFLNKEKYAPIAYKPKEHQIKALKQAVNYFVKENNTRGKLIFPCGAGKSLTGYWMTQELKSKSTIIAVPSLSLVKQTLDVYLREIVAKGIKVKWLCICSDEGIGSEEDIVFKTENLGVPCQTDPVYIKNWLLQNKDENIVIFTTYQSGRIIAEVSKNLNFTFNVGIFDEAHKTVGSDKKLFSHLLFEENIAIEKRIFMTATERFYAGSKDDIISMDDEDIYGDTFAQMSFKEAIEMELLTDYKVITIDVKKSEIADFIKDNNLVQLNDKWKKETEARSLASMLALRKAMKLFPIKNAVSFHSSIDKAVRNKELQSYITDTYKYAPIDTFTVSGKMPTTKRNIIVKEFADSSKSLITNARCLTEGVDVPNIDCIVFADPRKSKVDIVQALGRALRKKEGKEWGYVILPVVYDDLTQEIDNENFNEILAIVRGLASNDDRIIEYFKDKKEVGSSTKKENSDQFQFEVFSDYIDANQLSEQLQIKLWDKLSQFNWLPFEEAREFVWSLELSGQSLWKLFAKSDKRPYNIPSAPHLVYSENGWKGYGDWCGTGNVASWLKEFINFNDAREFVQKLGLKGESEWRLYCKSGEKPNYIPSSPKNQYPNEWKGFGDWLGTGTIATSHRTYKSFEEARKFVHKLGLQNNKEWLNYEKPSDIPAMPHKTYKGKGWISLGDWLGTNLVSWKELAKDFLTFSDAKKFVHTLGLKSRNEWLTYCASGKKPSNIPSSPKNSYKNDGWVGYGDFLGHGIKRFSDIEYATFSEARQYARSLTLRNQSEWFEYCKSGDLPLNMAKAPHHKYLGEGWVSWPDFLGSKGRGGKKKEWREFNKAREFARNLGLKNHSEWRIFASTNDKPKDIPSSANAIYAEEGWLGWTDFLGTKGRGSERKQMRDYDQAKKFVNSLGFKTRDEWQIYSKSDNKPIDIPASPSNYYEDYGWTNWGDWLGTGYVSPRERKYLPYVDAKKIVRGLNLESSNQWREYCKGENRPSNIPSNPNTTYKNNGWIDWSDWLGTTNVAVNKMIYRDFKEVKKYARAVGVKTQKEWMNHCKTSQKPIDIPTAVHNVYSDKGWVSWPDFLGKEK
jgi:superfamily II DNA or RNA helicase